MAVTYSKANQTAGLNSDTRLNAELTKIQTAFQDCLSRSGTAPNAMSADIDMGGNDILNVGAIDVASLTVDGAEVPSLADVVAAQAASEAARDAAQGYAVDAGVSASGAAQYAIEPEDSEIAPGIYSALHYAAKAAASAAGVNLPALGTAGQILQVNSGATALENHTPTSTATANAVARRDASGRMQAADPSAAQDVVTKAYHEANTGVVQTVSASTTTIFTINNTGANAIPQDNTIPQNTEGQEVISASITPTSASNKVRITLSMPVADWTNQATVAIFAGAADAVYATGSRSGSAEATTVAITFVHSPATTSPVTYSVRVGADAAGNGYINAGKAGVSLFGGVLSTQLVLEEIA